MLFLILSLNWVILWFQLYTFNSSGIYFGTFVGCFPNTIFSSLSKCHLFIPPIQLESKYYFEFLSEINIDWMPTMHKGSFCNVFFLTFPLRRNGDRILRSGIQKLILAGKKNKRKTWTIKFLAIIGTGYSHIQWDNELVQVTSKENTHGSLWVWVLLYNREGKWNRWEERFLHATISMNMWCCYIKTVVVDTMKTFPWNRAYGLKTGQY